MTPLERQMITECCKYHSMLIYDNMEKKSGVCIMQRVLLWGAVLLILIEASAYGVSLYLKYHLPGGGFSDNMFYSILYTYRRLPIVIVLLVFFAYTCKPGK